MPNFEIDFQVPDKDLTVTPSGAPNSYSGSGFPVVYADLSLMGGVWRIYSRFYDFGQSQFVVKEYTHSSGSAPSGVYTEDGGTATAEVEQL